MAKAKKAGKGKKADALVVASKVRQFLRSKKVNMGGEVIDALNCTVQCLLTKAVSRTVENKRKTLRPQDL